MDVFGVRPDLDDQLDGSLDGDRISTCVADVHGTIWWLDPLPDIHGDVRKVNEAERSSGVDNYEESRDIVNRFTIVRVKFIVTPREDVDGFGG